MASGVPPEVLGVGLLIVGGMLLGSLAVFFRQPLILAYIVVGAILAYFGVVDVASQRILAGLAGDLGIAFLLFVVGLELSFKKILEVKSVVTFGTVATCVLMFILGLFAGYFMGRTFIESVYFGLVLAFSSTLLVVKTLGEKGMVDTLPGRIMIGTLVFQDILVILAVSVLAILAGAEPTGFVSWVVTLPVISLVPFIDKLAILFGAILLFGLAYFTNRYIARYLFRFFANNSELLFVSSVGFFFALSFIAFELGFSLAIGAFISGVIIANTDVYLEVLGKIRTLAAFFSVLFFATLGFSLTFENFTTLLVPILVISVFTLLLKPVLTAVIVRMFGYDQRTSAMVGVHMSQVSEFSLILVAVGIAYGQVAADLLTITVLTLLITMTVSSYAMKYTTGVLRTVQRLFPRLQTDELTINKVAIEHASVVVYGIEHVDEALLENISKHHEHMIVIDPDPANIEYLRKRNVPSVLGSLANEEILERVHFKHLKILLSTVPDFEENLLVTAHVRKANKDALIVVPARKIKEALQLYEHGASYVLVTSFLDDHAVQSILFNPDKERLPEIRGKHIERLMAISARRQGAVDIEDFMAALTDQPLRAGREAFQRRAKPVFEEVDKFFKKR